MRVIVTGGTGFVGRHLVSALQGENEVVCLVRHPDAAPPLGRVTTVEWDFTRAMSRRRLPASADALVHLAQAYVPFPSDAETLFAVNAASTQWLAEYARRARVPRFVLASSGSVYRPRRTPLTEDAPLLPPTYHPATKQISELVLRYYNPYFTTAVLRLFAPYGPGQVNRLIPRLLAAVGSGAPIELSHGGEPRINPIYVDDLVRIFTEALTGTRSFTVNVAGPQVLSIRDLAQLIGSLVGRRPHFVERDSQTRGNLVADTHLMHELFTARPEVGLKDGLARMLDDSGERR